LGGSVPHGLFGDPSCAGILQGLDFFIAKKTAKVIANKLKTDLQMAQHYFLCKSQGQFQIQREGK
jgi:hypothetical protein